MSVTRAAGGIRSAPFLETNKCFAILSQLKFELPKTRCYINAICVMLYRAEVLKSFPIRARKEFNFANPNQIIERGCIRDDNLHCLSIKALSLSLRTCSIVRGRATP